AVCSIQRFQNLPGIFDSQFHWERTFELGSLDELHDQVVGSNIVDLTNVGVIQSRYSAGFLFEALGKLRGGDFDRNDAIEAGVACFVDFAHATCADGRKDLVGSEPSPGG